MFSRSFTDFTDMGDPSGRGGEWRRMGAREIEMITGSRAISPAEVARRLALYAPTGLGPDAEALADVASSDAGARHARGLTSPQEAVAIQNIHNALFGSL